MSDCYEMFLRGEYRNALDCCVKRLESENIGLGDVYTMYMSEIELGYIDLVERSLDSFLNNCSLEQKKSPLILEVQARIAEEYGINIKDREKTKEAMKIYDEVLHALNYFEASESIFLKKHEVYKRRGDCHLLLSEYKKGFDDFYQAFQCGLKFQFLSIYCLNSCYTCLEKTIGKYKANRFWIEHKKVIDDFYDNNPTTIRLFGEEVGIKYRNAEQYINIRDFCNKFNQSYKYVCGFVLSEKIYDGQTLKIGKDKYLNMALFPIFVFRGINTNKIKDEWIKSEIIEYENNCIREISDIIKNNPEIRREMHDKFPFLSGAPIVNLKSYLKRNYIEPTENNLQKFMKIAQKIYKETRGIDAIQVIFVDEEKNKLKETAWNFTELDLEILDKAIAEFMA